MLKIAIIILLFLTGCATDPVILSPDNKYADHYQSFPKDHKILLIPVENHFDQAKPGEQRVLNELAKQLKERGWSPVTINKVNYDEVWASTVSQVGGVYSPMSGQINGEKFHAAIKLFASTVQEKELFSALIFPSFVMKPATFKGSSLEWDGVRQPHKIIGNFPGSQWSGKSSALSLQLTVFNSDGSWAFTSFGGLALPYISNLQKTPPENQLKENIFDQEGQFEKSVQLALTPLSSKDR